MKLYVQQALIGSCLPGSPVYTLEVHKVHLRVQNERSDKRSLDEQREADCHGLRSKPRNDTEERTLFVTGSDPTATGSAEQRGLKEKAYLESVA